MSSKAGLPRGRGADAVSGEVVAAVDPPDPRWPSLHRWSKNIYSPPVNPPPKPPEVLSSDEIEPMVGTGETAAPTEPVAPTTERPISLKPPASTVNPPPNPPVILTSVGIETIKNSGESAAPVEPAAPVVNVVQTVEPVVSAKPPASPVTTLQGAWQIPINRSSTSRLLAPAHVATPSQEEWPSLVASTGKKPMATDGFDPGKKDQGKISIVDVGSRSVEDESLKSVSKDYPWAAKMDQSKRNLHRVTTPDYLEDGTPLVNIPSHVLSEGIENQKEFIIGQFYQCAAPSGGLIHAVMSKIWGRNCRIFTKKLSESSFLFHIPDEATRSWILQRAVWHVDDCLMFVAAWSPIANFAVPEITTIPVWLTLKNIPNQLYSFKGIKWIASGIGEPMLTSRPWLDPTQMGEAKILVEVKLDKPFPQKVALKEECGSITMVDVVYSWLPSKCRVCGQLGHKASRCLGMGLEKIVIPTCTNVTPSLTENSNVKASSKALDTAVVSNGAAILNGFNHTVVVSSVLPLLDVVEPNTEFLSSPISNEEAAIDLRSVEIHVASKKVDIVHNSVEKELLSSATKMMDTPAKVTSIITTSALGVQSGNNISFRKASSSNKFAVLDLASDVVLHDDSEGADSSGSDDSDEDLILNLKAPFSDKHLQDRPLQLPIQTINIGRGGRGRGRRGRGYRGRRGGFG